MCLTNYRRQGDGYSEEFSVAEAATATAAFEPFFGSPPAGVTGVHVGGGPDFACPAKATHLEARLLWPHMSGDRPDVLVSVGCGHQAGATPGRSRDCTNAGAMWTEAFGPSSEKEPDRYIRLCPEIRTVFEADDVSILARESPLMAGGLEQTLNAEDLRCKIDQVVRRLISTVFYFNRTASEGSKDRGWIIRGMYP
jgi:hypothetical protein